MTCDLRLRDALSVARIINLAHRFNCRCTRIDASAVPGATTQSLVMRSMSGTVRFVTARHALNKLAEFSQIEFG